MKSFQQLAKVAYEVHEREVIKPNGGKPYPWEELDPQLQASWVKAMQAVVAELVSVH